MQPSSPRVRSSRESSQTRSIAVQEELAKKAAQLALLPVSPKTSGNPGPLLGNDLSRVPEVHFETPLGLVKDEAIKHIAQQIARINHLNSEKTDGFLELLRSERPELHGLPFVMGDASRIKGEDRCQQFFLSAAIARNSCNSWLQTKKPSRGTKPASRPSTASVSEGNAGTEASAKSSGLEKFWWEQDYLWFRYEGDHPRMSRGERDLIATTRIAALMQILAPLPETHAGLVKHLSRVSHVEATRALAHLAIFSRDENAREAAIVALKIRRERDYTDILVNGLRYPWPVVAAHAAVAIAKLERNDLLPRLIDVLEQPDPRAPVMRTVKEKRIRVVRELVRVNHHRNCLLCHAPGNTENPRSNSVVAEVPVPGQPLSPNAGGYDTSRRDILVRFDVTYLRQDFSALQAVAGADPWPEMQRFDFLVRTPVLSEDEAAAYREKLKPREPGQLSPYQLAALAALRVLTGRDTEPTPEAWRRLLKLPADSPRKTATP